MSQARIGVLTALAIVLLRLATGFHFFSEGVQHLDPEFTSAYFLRAAKGPFAEYFHAKAPGPHGVYTHLAQPRKWEGALEEPDEPAYQDWADAILVDWRRQRDAALEVLSRSEPDQARVNAAYDAAEKQLNEYLKSQGEAIEEYQHKLWRLEELRAQVYHKGGTLPYVDDRIAEQERELAGAPNVWVAEVEAIERGYHEDISQAAPDGEVAPEELDAALNPPTELDRINTITTWVILGSGALLFVGLLTRVAAIAAAGFLLSVMVTQPPWAFGAETSFFYYQLVEFVALLFLAAVGAGRWLGFDGLLWTMAGGRHADDPS